MLLMSSSLVPTGRNAGGWGPALAAVLLMQLVQMMQPALAWSQPSPAAAVSAPIPPTSAPQPVVPPAMEPPAADPQGWDWLVLVSEEILKGKLVSMRQKSLVFHSAKLGERTFAWADVASVRSPKELVYVDEELREMVGPGLVSRASVSVRTPGGVLSVPRDQLLSIVPHDKSELDRWSLRVNLGATLRQGNSDTVDLSGALKVRRQDSLTRLLLDSNAAYGEVNGAATVQQTSTTGTLDVYLAQSFYLRPLLATAQTDRFKNIGFRGTLAAGAGFTVLDEVALSWDLNAAGGYQYTNYESAPVGLEDQSRDGIVMLGTRLETAPWPGVELDLNWQSYLALTNLDRTYHEGSATVSVDANDIIELRLAFYYDRVEQPVPDENGTVPRQDDYRLVAELGLDLW
jgi:putative salt-induced outer membrane protein YdiY